MSTTGIEPAANRLKAYRSTTELRTHKKERKRKNHFFMMRNNLFH